MFCQYRPSRQSVRAVGRQCGRTAFFTPRPEINRVTGAPTTQHGFTLVEMLVVLILTAMIAGILFQAMERMYRLQDRFGVARANAQHGVMARDWFRQTVAGLLPDYADGKNRFSGSEKQFSGLTTNPLSARYGALSAFEWKIAFDAGKGLSTLSYIEDRQEPSLETTLISWPGNNGRFIYLDTKGERHDAWPPPLGIWPQLPSQIHLQASEGGEEILILAIPMGAHSPLPRPRDFFGAGQ